LTHTQAGDGRPPQIFSRSLIALRRSRAADGYVRHDFLRRAAAQDALDRVGMVNRRFERALDLFGYRSLLASQIAEDPALSGRIGSLVSAPDCQPWAEGGLSVVCSEDRLPFATGAFSLVLAPLALHWIDDLPGLLVQIRSLLTPDGLFIGSALGGRSLHELRTCLLEAEADLVGGARPRVSPMIDVRQAAALLQRTGFAMPVSDVDRLSTTYPDPFALLRDLRGMAETAAFRRGETRPIRRDVLMRAVEIYRERFSDARGRITATFEIVTVSGWSPSPDQPSAKRPGSATVRLADALGVREQPLRAGDPD